MVVVKVTYLYIPFKNTHHDFPFHSVDTHVYDFPFHSVDTHVYDIETLYIHFVILLRPDIRHFRYESKLI